MERIVFFSTKFLFHILGLTPRFLLAEVPGAHRSNQSPRSLITFPFHGRDSSEILTRFFRDSGPDSRMIDGHQPTAKICLPTLSKDVIELNYHGQIMGRNSSGRSRNCNLHTVAADSSYDPLPLAVHHVTSPVGGALAESLGHATQLSPSSFH